MEKRKIVFIAPEFYDYHKIITAKLRELFGETFFFPERKTNWLYTILNNIHPKLINLYQKIYYPEGMFLVVEKLIENYIAFAHMGEASYLAPIGQKFEEKIP